MPTAVSREIGSEYWNVPVCEKENGLFEGVSWFLSGRSALQFIIKDIKEKHNVKTAALPSWCCDSMILPFLNEGIVTLFYEDIIPDCDILLTMEYFGFMRNNPIDFHGIVIYDVTHSLFSPNMGIKRAKSATDEYLFGSLRKWAGFKTGGFARKLNGEFSMPIPDVADEKYISLRARAMKEKAEYLSGKREDKAYLNIFSTAEDMLEDAGVLASYNEDILAANKLDIEFIKTARRKNAKILLSEVAEIALYKELGEDDVPLFVPIILPEKERNALRKYLIENNVFCPIHWPYTKWHGEKSNVFDTELSLICDQRYTKEDMEYICELIRKFRRCGN